MVPRLLRLLLRRAALVPRSLAVRPMPQWPQDQSERPWDQCRTPCRTNASDRGTNATRLRTNSCDRGTNAARSGPMRATVAPMLHASLDQYVRPWYECCTLRINASDRGTNVARLRTKTCDRGTNVARSGPMRATEVPALHASGPIGATVGPCNPQDQSERAWDQNLLRLGLVKPAGAISSN